MCLAEFEIDDGPVVHVCREAPAEHFGFLLRGGTDVERDGQCATGPKASHADVKRLVFRGPRQLRPVGDQRNHA